MNTIIPFNAGGNAAQRRKDKRLSRRVISALASRKFVPTEAEMRAAGYVPGAVAVLLAQAHFDNLAEGSFFQRVKFAWRILRGYPPYAVPMPNRPCLLEIIELYKEFDDMLTGVRFH